MRRFETPEHTCGTYNGEPQRGCPGCEHIVGRFAELWPLALTCAVEDEDGEFANNDEGFDATFYELHDLGLMPPVWWTCAVAITQLAHAPAKIDRVRMWGNLLTARAEPGLQPTLDLVDALLMQCGLNDRQESINILMRMANLPVRLQAAIQLTLCAAAHHSLRTELTVWQLVVHTRMIGDVWHAPHRPMETLMAARITGARAAGDLAHADQLIRRAARQGYLGGVALTLATACAARMPEPGRMAVLHVNGGVPDYLLNVLADLDTTDDVGEQGFMLAARAIAAVAARDPGDEVRALLEEDPTGQRSRSMISAITAIHAAIAQAAWGGYVAEREAQDHRGGVSP